MFSAGSTSISVADSVRKMVSTNDPEEPGALGGLSLVGRGGGWLGEMDRGVEIGTQLL